MPPIKDAIRMARTYEKFNPAWVEDLFNAGSVWYWQGYKAVREATTAKILTGEDGFGLEECFKALIDNKAVDIVQPDPGTSGQCRETKRIADYAYDHDVNVSLPHGRFPPGDDLGSALRGHPPKLSGHGMPRGGLYVLVAGTGDGRTEAADRPGLHYRAGHSRPGYRAERTRH
jgi:hypothetical protein